MDLKTIRTLLEKNNPGDEGMRHYSVLVPLVNINDEVHLLFEVRSSDLRHQPNEICFPGGRLECRETAEAAAIRETCEELGIQSSSIEIIRRLQPVVTPFNMTLHVFAGILAPSVLSLMSLNRDEVAEVFTVPLDWFLENDPEEHTIETHLQIPDDFPYHKIENGEAYPWKKGSYSILFYTYGERVIWGMTARITNDFINRLKDRKTG